MTDAMAEAPDVVALLRRLDAAAAASVSPRADLGATVLTRYRSSRRRRRRTAVAGAVALLAGGAVVAASRPDGGAFAEVYQPSGAMEPTVHVGEHTIVGKHLEPRVGDVVTTRVPGGGGSFAGLDRLVAVGGDVVACPDDGHGRCTGWVVDGRLLSEPYLARRTSEPYPPTRVRAHHVFVLGDDRDDAADSRVYGDYDESWLTGVVVRIVDAAGVRRAVPGAPLRPGPDGGGTIDPPGEVPPARSVP